MCSKLMFLSAFNTLITVTLQTYGALVGVHVLSAVVLKD